VISAADGRATIYQLLAGAYADKAIDEQYSAQPTFPSYLQVSLGVARNLSHKPGLVSRLLAQPITIDPETQTSQLSFRIFHYDPTFAPRGKTAVTCQLHTYNFAYWENLWRHEPAHYQAEKTRVADAVIDAFERSVPGVREAIEVVDVSTPATVIQYTGNWKGSMEGWLLTPRTRFRPLRRDLPGLKNFMMVGQWVMPGGGLPSGLMTARSAIQAICRQDGVEFLPAGMEAHSQVA
jgi:phytoene dehydrogenase-like protein